MRLLAAVSVAALWVQSAPAAVVALVVGADYRAADESRLALVNTLIDAAAVTTLLRKIGAADVQLIENPSGDDWQAAVARFVQTLRPDDIAVLYYAGHAVQVNGENYFVTADGEALVSAEEILSAVMQRARGTIFAIDACRNNPFRKATAFERIVKVRDVGPTDARSYQTFEMSDLVSVTGLSQMNNVRGRNAVVLFSTEPGNVAVDGAPGDGSPFAHAVVRELGRRQSFDAAVRRITDAVSQATRGTQSPWRQGDLGFPLFLAGQPRFPVP